mmetsp:Transcript_18860/g.54534  ORF Transcript_18860/g.54534 Transcript_18860/m.54534 type:complete len:226 (-) Transcript_18860:100-777(-)
MEVALQQSVLVGADLHLAGVADDVELHRVGVVLQSNIVLTPSQLERRARLRRRALGQIDGTLKLPIPAHDARALGSLCPSLARVWVPRRSLLVAPLNNAPLQRLRRPVVAHADAHRILELLQLGLRNLPLLHRHMPIHDLRARGRRQRALVGVELGERLVFVQRGEVDRALELGDDGGIRHATVRARSRALVRVRRRQGVFELCKKRIALGVRHLEEETEDAKVR